MLSFNPQCLFGVRRDGIRGQNYIKMLTCANQEGENLRGGAKKGVAVAYEQSLSLHVLKGMQALGS